MPTYGLTLSDWAHPNNGGGRISILIDIDAPSPEIADRILKRKIANLFRYPIAGLLAETQSTPGTQYTTSVGVYPNVPVNDFTAGPNTMIGQYPNGYSTTVPNPYGHWENGFWTTGPGAGGSIPIQIIDSNATGQTWLSIGSTSGATNSDPPEAVTAYTLGMMHY